MTRIRRVFGATSEAFRFAVTFQRISRSTLRQATMLRRNAENSPRRRRKPSDGRKLALAHKHDGNDAPTPARDIAPARRQVPPHRERELHTTSPLSGGHGN